MRRSLSVALLAPFLLTACGDDAVSPSTRTLRAALADGSALPSTVACPAPWENSEAWVAFGDGTLLLYPNGEFRWDFAVGRGYRTWQPGPDGSRQNLAQYAEGTPKSIHGRWVRGADGSATLSFEDASTPETPLTGSGRVLADRAELTEAVACPHAPDGTPPHVFQITLR